MTDGKTNDSDQPAPENGDGGSTPELEGQAPDAIESDITAAPVPDEAAAGEEATEAERPAAGEAAPESPLAALEAEVADLKDQLLRAMAETENVRRRGQREREDTAKYAAANFAKDLLSVADNLRRALEAVSAESRKADEALEALATGLELTQRELDAAFERHGIRRLEPLGEAFDPNFHQAMFEVEDDGNPPGTVVQLMQAGYVMNDRLLRPAMVGVAKAKKDEGEGDDAPKVDTTA